MHIPSKKEKKIMCAYMHVFRSIYQFHFFFSFLFLLYIYVLSFQMHTTNATILENAPKEENASVVIKEESSGDPIEGVPLVKVEELVESPAVLNTSPCSPSPPAIPSCSRSPSPPPVLASTSTCRGKAGDRCNKKREAESVLDASINKINEIVERELDKQRAKQAKSEIGDVMELMFNTLSEGMCPASKDEYFRASMQFLLDYKNKCQQKRLCQGGGPSTA